MLIDQYISPHNPIKEAHSALAAQKGYPVSSSDQLTTAQLNYEAAAKIYLANGESDNAFAVRQEAAEKIGCRFTSLHPLAEIRSLPRANEGSLEVDQLGAGGISMQRLTAAAKMRSDGTQLNEYTFHLTHPTREALQSSLNKIQQFPERLAAHLPSCLAGAEVSVREVDDGYDLYDPEADTFSPESPTPFTDCKVKFDSAGNVTVTHDDARALEIEFKGIGKVIIGNRDSWGNFFNRVRVEIDDHGNPETSLRQLHAMLTMVGIGEAACPSRAVDVERLETALLFHELMQGKAFPLEKKLDFYTMPPHELKEAILREHPQMAEQFEKYLEGTTPLFYKAELSSGRVGYVIADRAEQVRQAGGVGLVTSIYPKDLEGGLNSAVAVLASGQEASSLRAAKGGVKASKSTVLDHLFGGARKVFLRLVTESELNDPRRSPEKQGDVAIKLLYPLEVVNAVRSRGNASDFFGAGRKGFTGPDGTHYDCYAERPAIAQLAAAITDSDKSAIKSYMKEDDYSNGLINEVMIEGKIAPKQACGMLIQMGPHENIEDVKEKVHAKFKEAGLLIDGQVTLPGGKPIRAEDFFHFQVKGQTLYKKKFFPTGKVTPPLVSDPRAQPPKAQLSAAALAQASTIASHFTGRSPLARDSFPQLNKQFDELKGTPHWQEGISRAVASLTTGELRALASRNLYELQGYDRQMLSGLLSAATLEIDKRGLMTGELLARQNEKIKALETKVIDIDESQWKTIGSGANNTVYLIPGHGVFKPDTADLDPMTMLKESLFGTTVALGIPPGVEAHMPARAVASSLVDILLHGEEQRIAVKTEYVIINGKRGVLMENAKANDANANAPKLTGLKTMDIDRQAFHELDAVVSRYMDKREELTPMDLNIIANMTNSRDVQAERINGKWRFSGQFPQFQNFNPDNARTAERLIDAQLLDIICGQGDRHPQNYFVTSGGNVILIDNDCAFGRDAMPEGVDVRTQSALRGIVPNNASLMLRFPNVYTNEQKVRIEQLQANQEALKALLTPYISSEEIQATCSRLDRLVSHMNSPGVLIVEERKELLSTEAFKRMDSNNSYWSRELQVYDSKRQGWNYLREHRGADVKT
jgi:hypothetical protein